MSDRHLAGAMGLGSQVPGPRIRFVVVCTFILRWPLSYPFLSYPKHKMLLNDLLDVARDCGDIGQLSISQFISLSSLISHLRERLSWHHTSNSNTLPIYLPADVATFLCVVLDISDDELLNCWDVLRSLLMKLETENEDNVAFRHPLRNASLLPVFLQCGLPFKIGMSVNFLYSYVF